MKNLILKISCAIICIAGIITGIISLSLNGNTISVVNTNSENIDSFISSIASTLLSSYEIDITGDVLEDAQKKYITDMYILQHREKYSNISTDDKGKNSIKISEYNEAYYYLFGDVYNSSEEYVELNDLNMEKFHINSYNILSYKSENDVHILEVTYSQVFSENQYNYNIRYSVGFKNGKYYLIGFKPIN